MTERLRAALARLRRPEEVRRRAGDVLAWVEAGRSPHFRLDSGRLEPLADYVAEIIRERFPGLDVPFHSRWRHFAIGGIDRAGELLAGRSGAERARAAIDLVVVSVLLDAGAGPAWRFRDPATGRELTRSEGLAIASLEAFRAGAFSSDPDDPLRADGERLAGLEPARLAACFQLRADNPLIGFDGRAALLRRLGRVVAAGGCFGRPGRIGNLYDHWRAEANDGSLGAHALLRTLLESLSEVWPRDPLPGPLAGLPLGDVWPHPAVRRDDETHGLVPFHKLSQWLAYSLVEPLAQAAIPIAGLDALTGLPEYRNGGLLVDSGVLEPRDPRSAARSFAPGDELVVEWRALTVALLDALAPIVRRRLGVAEAALPLLRLLEGGTWYAGRRLAAERRPGGGPPFTVTSDGTVF